MPTVYQSRLRCQRLFPRDQLTEKTPRLSLLPKEPFRNKTKHKQHIKTKSSYTSVIWKPRFIIQCVAICTIHALTWRWRYGVSKYLDKLITVDAGHLLPCQHEIFTIRRHEATQQSYSRHIKDELSWYRDQRTFTIRDNSRRGHR